MAQTKILIDSNAYFRLAQSIHPLLQVEFGQAHYCLYVIKDLQAEYDRNPRLRNAFSWVNEVEYRRNRSCELNIPRKDRKDIERAFDIIRGHARDTHPETSKVDIGALAHAYILDIPVVTDDAAMLELAQDFNIKTLKTLELLKLMLDCGHIDMAIVRQIAAYWSYEDDKPKFFSADYRKL
ncbi:MAG: DNA-binding protein, partial [Proteobacteria bacterium]|nr:DNA-binding protein [Pseudomonadota bacterium]